MKKFLRKTTAEDFVLTINPKYIPAWGKWEALREIMQNVIDRKREYEAAEIIFDYNANRQRVTIGNKMSYLEKKTMILGETTKADNAQLVGQYGEGYKLALLVFLRMGTRVRIRNGSEIWAPSIKFSEQFGTELLTITVLPAAHTDNLIFELDGITLDDYKQFKANCLEIDPPTEKITTSLGDILLEEKFRSRLFVEGLFICKFSDAEKIRYGYNMRAGKIELDRDRKKVGTFNLLWQLGTMYGELDSTYANFVYQLRAEKWLDVDYYESMSANKTKPLYQALASMHYADFIATYGQNVIPVQNEEEAKLVREKYNHLRPIITERIKYEYITASNAYKSSDTSKLPVEETPYSIIKKIIKKKVKDKELCEELLEELLPLARKWQKR